MLFDPVTREVITLLDRSHQGISKFAGFKGDSIVASNITCYSIPKFLDIHFRECRSLNGFIHPDDSAPISRLLFDNLFEGISLLCIGLRALAANSHRTRITQNAVMLGHISPLRSLSGPALSAGFGLFG